MADRQQEEAPARPLPPYASHSDNVRGRRCIAGCTIDPAIGRGTLHGVGSVVVGGLADPVIRSPAFFAVTPDMVVRGGSMMRGARPFPFCNPDPPAISDLAATATATAAGGLRTGATP